jgi:hypothetical protein
MMKKAAPATSRAVWPDSARVPSVVSRDEPLRRRREVRSLGLCDRVVDLHGSGQFLKAAPQHPDHGC